MERFKSGHAYGGEYKWHDKIDWHSPDVDRQIADLYAQTCTDFKDWPNFRGVFQRLAIEFSKTYPGPQGDRIFAEWMITQLRKEFLGRA